jgi:hypothetical protein
MYRALRLLLLALLVLPACRTARDVAESSAHVVTAPVRFVDRKIHGSDENVDQVYEARPVEQMPPPAPLVQGTPPVMRQRPVTASPTPSRAPEQTASTQMAPASTPRTPTSSAPAAQFPVAKPVPGKPGYVFSPYDPSGGYVDVTGYPSGSKVKDPYSQKIFLVP